MLSLANHVSVYVSYDVSNEKLMLMSRLLGLLSLSLLVYLHPMKRSLVMHTRYLDNEFSHKLILLLVHLL